MTLHSNTKEGDGDEDEDWGRDEDGDEGRDENEYDDHDKEEGPTPQIVRRNSTHNRQPLSYGTHSAQRFAIHICLC
ncbi:hypothetical protein J1N35_024650 [Gossypium stocksii]|uniref:Uncharacterized protein n=1 Tax=Gossypium stocksii TaxID=47602 RepID=A0A9D3V547_9ROSI|nr:hypothetical protein J1N35_024650 [Gossypium stocksii]